MPINPNYDCLPEHIRGGMQRYIEQGILPGDFLQAVICNNLRESFMFADDTNIIRMFDIVKFMYSEAPTICWGSEEKMLVWNKIQRCSFCSKKAIGEAWNITEETWNSLCQEHFDIENPDKWQPY